MTESVSDLSDLNVVALARRYLRSRPAVVELLGDRDAIGTLNEPPYPCLRLSDPPGLDRGLRHLVAPQLTVEVLGDPTVTGQRPLLRRALYRALVALEDLPRAQAAGEWTLEDGVVTAVESTAGGGFVPEPPAQPRYVSTLRLYMHP